MVIRALLHDPFGPPVRRPVPLEDQVRPLTHRRSAGAGRAARRRPPGSWCCSDPPGA
jgi:hypothetical protein